ncbi:MAG: NUDIX domain-containing protein [Nitrospirota bacterium]
MVHPVQTYPLREVITVFLSHAGKVLVVKRSTKVGTYQGKWSGVSGYLERSDPLDQAYTEIAEEVGLNRDQVTLVRRGAPLEVVDHVRGRAWRIHPFLFTVREPQQIRLDWENTEMRWIHPREISRFDTVPGLAEVLERVLATDGLD